MANFVFIVTSSPIDNRTVTAISIIEATLKQSHQVSVFFYQDGVLNASDTVSIPSDEHQSLEQWQRLHNTYQLPLHLCVTAAEKRGLSVDDDNNNNVNQSFTVSGLGELVELVSTADRVVQL